MNLDKVRNHLAYIDKNRINDPDAVSHKDASRACPGTQEFAYKSLVPLSMLLCTYTSDIENISSTPVLELKTREELLLPKIRAIPLASQYVTDSILIHIEKNAKLFFNKYKKVVFKSLKAIHFLHIKFNVHKKNYL